MGIFNEFFKKEKPVFTGLKFGFGSGAAGPDGPGFYEGSASGGAISGGIADPTGNFRYFVFPEPGNMTLGSDVDGPLISILAVGGGGGGGSGHAGGGGAGAVIHLDFGGSPVPGATHPVAVGGGGAAGNSPNKGSKGGTTTFGTNPSNYYISAPGGGLGGGWNDNSGKGGDGGSGGGDSGTPTGVSATVPAAESIANANKFNGNATSYGNTGGVGGYAGGGGGGAGTVGQTTGGPATAGPNPTTIPEGHPNYPQGGGGGEGPFAAGAPYQNPNIMTSAPFAATIWPPAVSYAGPNSPPAGQDIGAWGGHGRPFSEFPAPEIAPGIHHQIELIGLVQLDLLASLVLAVVADLILMPVTHSLQVVVEWVELVVVEMVVNTHPQELVPLVLPEDSYLQDQVVVEQETNQSQEDRVERVS